MAEATRAAILDLIETENPTLAGLNSARKMAYTEAGQMDALKALISELAPAVKSGRGSEKHLRSALALGAALWILGRYEDAVEPLTIVKDNPAAACILGQCLLQTQRAEEAIAAFHAAETRLHNETAPAFGHIEALAKAGRAAEAMERLNKLLPAHEKSAELHCLKGVILCRMGDVEAGLDAIEHATNLDPEHAGAWFQLGYWLDLRGQDDQALVSYEKSVAIRPARFNALLNLGVLYEDKREYEKAVECYRRALSADPTSLRARLYLKDAEACLEQFYDEDTRRRSDRASALLTTPVSDFELSVRSRNCLARMNVRNLGDLVRLTEEDLLGFKNFGETSLNEIKDMLKAKGLRFGMALAEQPHAVADVLKAPTAEQQDVLDRPVADLEFSIRSRRALESLGIVTVRDIIRHSEEDLLQCKNFGQTSLTEITRKLSEFGLSLRKQEE